MLVRFRELEIDRLAWKGLLVCMALVCVTGAVALAQPAEDPKNPGFTDTPYLPDGKWRVHDAFRPRPAVVTPGNGSVGVPGTAPSDAVVLFDGTDLSKWLGTSSREDGSKPIPAPWKVQDGYFEVAGGTGSIYSKEKFGDCQIHLEWASPSEVKGNSQGRGNSGVLIMGQYEVQVLDSYDNLTYADGQAGAMYGQFPPMVNATRPPGEWQVYDIVFEAPRFKGGELEKPAYVTVFLNGVLLHHRRAFIGSVVWRDLAKYTTTDSMGPIMLQDHGNPVRFRNIWVRPLSLN